MDGAVARFDAYDIDGALNGPLEEGEVNFYPQGKGISPEIGIKPVKG